jgi:hypothetical protein
MKHYAPVGGEPYSGRIRQAAENDLFLESGLQGGR